ncbi:MAG: GSCFA domain-containing protein, partial [Alphaproteobacteria bacterium]|nr:GSCFA domain-containing protein [Alphaproteobacteria bacterium]
MDRRTTTREEDRELAIKFHRQAFVNLSSTGKAKSGVRAIKAASIVDPTFGDSLLLHARALTSSELSVVHRPTALRYIRWAKSTAPSEAEAWIREGVLFSHMGREDLALPSFKRASDLDTSSFEAARRAVGAARSMDFWDIVEAYHARCVKLRPDDPSVQATSRELSERRHDKTRPMISRFPNSMEEFADFPTALSRHLFGKLNLPRVLRSDSKIFATGSCFAVNIAALLKQKGYAAGANDFGEEINSTLANREYFDWLLPESPPASEIGLVISETQRRLARQTLLASDVIVFTVGVAPVFLDRSTGALRLPTAEGASVHRLLRECEIRTLSVQENVDNLKYILKQIRRHLPATSVFLTLSPVPLNTTFEYPSAIMADCVSKSVLRVAIDQIMRERLLDVHYWPAFEAVRWIGGYHGDAYGKDDGSPS